MLGRVHMKPHLNNKNHTHTHTHTYGFDFYLFQHDHRRFSWSSKTLQAEKRKSRFSSKSYAGKSSSCVIFFVQSLLTFASKPVIIRVVHRSCHAKVTQLDHVTGTYHAVPQCQIAMKENNRRHLICTFEHARTSLAGIPPSPPLLGAFGLRTSVVRGFELSSVRTNPHQAIFFKIDWQMCQS